ncbi:Fc.00g072120.m01.CDS01 [Cosmosporella sp. VM-42]
MSDPFSIATGVVSLVAPTLHGIRLLHDDIANIKGVPWALETLMCDLDLLDWALESIDGIKYVRLADFGEALPNDAGATIASCSNICAQFRTNLRSWTKGSTDGKLSWLDRIKIGVFKQSQIKSMATQLHNYQTTITTMVSVAILQGRTFHISIE